MPPAPNHPVVVWGTCFLWVASLFAMVWSLALFIGIGDMLVLTKTDLVNACVMLSGILMLPTNVYLVHYISQGISINRQTRVYLCPLWLCIFCIVFINVVGILFCLRSLECSAQCIHAVLSNSLKNYKTKLNYKRFIDTLQWSLQCCGLKSYKDWFDHNWYDKVDEYDVHPNDRNVADSSSIVDSVPLSCCKSGSCNANFLTELGTKSINISGCQNIVYRIIRASMIFHMCFFMTITFAELLVLKYVTHSDQPKGVDKKYSEVLNVHQIMAMKENFDNSSDSLIIEQEEDSS